MTEPKTLVFENILLHSGWAKNVKITVDETGFIKTIKKNSKHFGKNFIKGTVLPGMINLHCHSHQRTIAGLTEYPSEGKNNFWSWRNQMYKQIEKINPSHFYAISNFVYLEMILQTQPFSIEDLIFHPLYYFYRER